MKLLLQILNLAFCLFLSIDCISNEKYFDYLPKYRSYNNHYQIDKIEYRKDRTIIYFRFIIEKSGNHVFHGNAHPQSWFLRTPLRMRDLREKYSLLSINNINVNGSRILNTLTTIPEVSFPLNKGDVVTCELNFEKLPYYIRMLDLIEGEGGNYDQGKHNCFDLMIKSSSSSLLGSEQNYSKVVMKFEETFDYLKYREVNTKTPKTNKSKVENSVVSSNQNIPNNSVKEKTVVVSSRGDQLIENSGVPEPIDYMPKTANSIVDFECNERILLPNLNFREEEIKFLGRIKAIQSLKIVVAYLNKFKDSRIKLHGHTDIYGNRKRNKELSKLRAFYVRNELKRMGIPYDRMSVYYYGGDNPLKKYRNGGSQNRRVEIEPICVK